MWGVSRAVLAVCLLALGVTSGFAQNTNSGDIRGTVTDASGAVVEGVKVTVTNLDTGITTEFVTNGSGLYDTNSLPPGNYKVVFTKDGFEKVVVQPVELRVGISTVDGKLKVGSVSEEMVVSAESPLLETETAEQSTTLEADTMSRLPQFGQNWANFAILLPGTAGAPSSSQGTVNPGTGVAVNGNLPYYSNFLSDGASTTLPHSANVDVSTFETVAEVQISTSSFSAQYGIGGAVFNQISKSGTNDFHGSAYEYFQNNYLNARSFFDDPTQGAPLLRYNNFGGSVGGPILKNKLFFYFNMDKITSPSNYNGITTVPTAAEKAGDFSALLGAPLVDKNGVPVTNPCDGNAPVLSGQIFDPSTTQTVGGQVCRKPFANNHITNFDSVAQALQAYYPDPNLPGLTNNYRYLAVYPAPSIRYFGRLDYDISKKNRLSTSWISRDNNAFYQNEFPCPINCQHGDVSGFVAQVSDVWTISPTFVNEFRFGYNRQGNWFIPASLGGGIPQKVGLQYSKADVMPDITIDGAHFNGLYASTNAVYVENSFEPSDVVTLIRGKHILHFGGELLAYQDNSTPWGNVQSGEFNFNGSYTTYSPSGTPGTGFAYADFLLGQVHSWSANNQPEAGGRQKSPQFFIQDDIKLRPNLTVNLGLRYQIQGGWSEVHNQQGTFDPTIVNPATGTLGAMWFAGQNGRTQLQAPIYDIFLPRVGVAWSPKSNTTVRGGFGIYAYNWSLDTYGNGMGFGSNSFGSVSDQTNGVTPVALLSGSGSNLQYLAASRSASAYNGQDVSYNPYHTPVAKIYQWNLSIQREIGRSMLAEIAYVGSHGTNLSYPVDLNQVPVDKLSPTDTGSRPFPQFGHLSGDLHNAISNYNALQLQIQRRLTSGLSFNANYTWSHFLDEQDSSGWGNRAGNQPYQNAFDPSSNYGNSNFDITHIFKANAVYELPFGKGKTLLNQNALLDAVVGGWQTSATAIAQTGNPFTVTYSGPDQSYLNKGGQWGGNWFPNLVGNPNPSNQTIQQWFNPAAYAVATPGTLGNSGRNTLRGPGLWDVNFSMAKTFSWRERLHLQVRADASNVFNHPSFGHPDTNFNDPNAGQITSTTVNGRNIQLGARLSF